MTWLQIEFELGNLDPERAEEHLLDFGALAVSFRDSGDDPVLEPAPGSTPLWQETTVTALLQEPVDRREALSSMAILGIDELKFIELPDKDWRAEWQHQSKPMRFGTRLWLYPWREKYPDDGRIVVEMEPGLAFGTGEHPTTAMCLRWLDAHFTPGKQVLDYGCGSGILSVAAAALGARHCVAVDIDPQALLATKQNALQNHRQDTISVMQPTILQLQPEYDVVLANILSGTLLKLAPDLQMLSAPKSHLVLSGILEQQAEQVITGFDWIKLEVADQVDEWVLLHGYLP
jgi:ribosomal protein L11 methyltransferase